MFGVGPEELALVFIIALLVLGPDRLPKVARDLGRTIGDLRRTSDEFRDEFLNADKYLAPSAPAGAAAPALEDVKPAETPAVPADPNETPFDREMREARDRLETPFDREMREARERLAASKEPTS
jgi:TatA/E family protein of Tat protein translocase